MLYRSLAGMIVAVTAAVSLAWAEDAPVPASAAVPPPVAVAETVTLPQADPPPGAVASVRILARSVASDPWDTMTPSAQFRLVKPGTGLLGKRITVQIDPEEQYDVTKVVDPRLPQIPMPPPPGATRDQADWFWGALSPRLADGRDTRMQDAMALLRNHPLGTARLTPDTGFMRRLAQKYGADIQNGTRNKRVSPAFVLAVIGVESAGNPKAVSSAGATGLMQLIPATAKRFGVREATDPSQNIAGGAAYLDWLLSEFGQDPLLALAGYNAGENAVKQYGGIPPYAETRNYVPKVVAAWQVARNLCKTPPDHVRQGCVFN